MSALLLLFTSFLLLLRKIKTDTHPLGLSALTQLLKKFHEYFCVAKRLLLKQSLSLTFTSYLTLDF